MADRGAACALDNSILPQGEALLKAQLKRAYEFLVLVSWWGAVRHVTVAPTSTSSAIVFHNEQMHSSRHFFSKYDYLAVPVPT